MSRVLLVNMPWSAARIPSFGIGLLTSILQDRGISVSTFYANVRFSQTLFDHFLHPDVRKTLNAEPGETRRRNFLTQDHYPRSLVDEYVFCTHYYGKRDADDRQYWDLYCERDDNRQMVRLWKETRKIIPGFIEDCLDEVIARDCNIVGFTSMFGQNLSSLLLARRIKKEMPESVIVFGGANCEGEMGEALLVNFPQIDFVVSGEAEISFPALIASIDRNESPRDVKGVVWRDGGGTVHHNGYSPPFRDLDALPVPDYREYFRELERTSYAKDIEPLVFLEQTRGCWWGQKHHCTFCGLNADGMLYRKKSDERCLEDLREIAAQVPTKHIHYADNILDMRKFGGFLQDVKREDLGLSLFFEIKSNIPKGKMKILKDAGAYSVQPGIENFSTKVLKEMRKGCTGLQNVQCLKWCKQYGIEALWNVLYGFPGETSADYETNLEILQSITHLDRQTCIEKIITQRFSPNYDEAEARGFANIRPQKAYRYVYDLPEEELARICYSFDYDYRSPRDFSRELRALNEFNRRWADSEDPGTIVYMPLEDGGAMIVDTRFNVGPNVVRLGALQNLVLRYLDTIRTRELIIRYGDGIGWNLDEGIMDFVIAMQEQRFVVSEGERYLGVIPIPDGEVAEEADQALARMQPDQESAALTA